MDEKRRKGTSENLLLTNNSIGYVCPAKTTTMLKPQEWESVMDNPASGRTIICLGAEMFTQSGKELEQPSSLLLKTKT